MGQAANARPIVFLTGADGFTGVYARAELEAAGYRVVGAVVGAPRHDDEVRLDITSLEECRAVMEAVRPDYLMHLAGISFVGHVDVSAFHRVNVEGTINLIQALADAGVTPRRILIASSANVYGNVGGVLTEAQPPAPVNVYAESKLEMERRVKAWNERFPIVITRPFNYTGIGQAPHFLVPKIVDHFRRRAPVIELGNLDVARDFSDVRMVAAAYHGLLEKDCAGEIVNICSGRPYELGSILRMMEEITGHHIEVRVNPEFVRDDEIKILAGSPEKLRAILGALPARPLEETLRWMASA